MENSVVCFALLWVLRYITVNGYILALRWDGLTGLPRLVLGPLWSLAVPPISLFWVPNAYLIVRICDWTCPCQLLPKILPKILPMIPRRSSLLLA